MTPLFTERASVSLDRARAIYETRGDQYSDDWRDRRMVTLQAVSKELGIVICPLHEKAIAAAVMCDIKYWRGLGGYKDDHLIDGINYQAYLAQEMRAITEFKEPVLSAECCHFSRKNGHSKENSK